MLSFNDIYKRTDIENIDLWIRKAQINVNYT